MRDKILSVTKKHIVSATNSNPPFEEWDYSEYSPQIKTLLNKEWKGLSESDRIERYENKITNYYSKKGFYDPTPKQNNYRLIWEEGERRLKPNSGIKLLEINDYLQDRAVLEFLEMIENTDQIKSLYKFKKKGVGGSKNAGIEADEAEIIKSCLRQGRELFESGRKSPMMIKPLIFFYSLTAYAYSLVVLNNPIRYKLSMLPSSHGLKFVGEKFKIQFGAGTSEGTFSDLFVSFPVINHISNGIEILQDNRESIKEFWKASYEISIGELLSMIPELRDYYKLVTETDGRTHPLTIERSNNPRSISWDIYIGDGVTQPSQQDINNSFADFEKYNSRGKSVIEVPDDKSHKIRGTVFSDLHGEFWYVENPLYPIVLPEICVHFLLMSAFSNIMRYNPNEWNQILENETDSKISLLIRKYITIMENKLPVLLIRGLTDFHAFLSKR